MEMRTLRLKPLISDIYIWDL